MGAILAALNTTMRALELAAIASLAAIAVLSATGCPDEAPALVSLPGDDLLDAGRSDHSVSIPDCDDFNPCTDDTYDPVLQQCRHAHRVGTCDDSNACTEQDSCVDGVCAGNPVICDDGVDCTIDYCQPVAGCEALPDATRCVTGDDPCLAAVCDPSAGCLVATAIDGTECGPRSCVELAVCVAGQCRRGPTPDGFPCDDGDGCTTGDTCHGGSCLASTVGTFGISTPTEVDLGSDVSDHATPEPPSAVGILAVGATSAGGIDVVWVHHLMWMSDSSVMVLRTRIASDNRVVFQQHLARTQHARAAFFGDRLLLLTYNYGTCQPLAGELDPAPEWSGYNACGFVLHQFGVVDSTVSPTVRLPLDDTIAGIEGATVYGDGPALAVDSEAAYVAIPKQQFAPAGWSVGIVRVNHGDQTIQTSLLPIDDREGLIPFRNLQLAAIDGLRAVGYERRVDELTLPTGCAAACSDGSLDSAVCEAPLFQPALTLLRDGLAPTVVELARSRSRAFSFAATTAGGGVLLQSHDPAQNSAANAVDPPANQPVPPFETCPLFDRLSAFVVNPATATFAIHDLFLDGPGAVRALTPATLFGGPAALWHRADTWIAIAGRGADGAPLSIAVDHPQSSVSRVLRRFATSSWPPFSPSATVPMGQGFVAAVVVEDDPTAWSGESPGPDSSDAPPPQPQWTSNGIALFTVGCGVSIPPLR